MLNKTAEACNFKANVKIIQISDLHFGTVLPEVERALKVAIESLQADILIVSGDITQRATSSQFRAAKIFIESLDVKHKLIVPGNHDISLFKLWERLFYPYRKFKEHFGIMFPRTLNISNVSICVLNSTNPWRHIQGDFSYDKSQLTKLFDKQDSAFSLVVFHHPMDCRKPMDEKNLLKDRTSRVHDFHNAGIDLILGGHIHDPHVALSNDR